MGDGQGVERIFPYRKERKYIFIKWVRVDGQ
jgi:hypothetical protein